MKAILLLLTVLLIAITSTAQAQFVAGQHLKDIRTPYIQIMGRSRFLSDKVDIYIDFGQAGSVQWAQKKLVDANGKHIIFNSMMDAMNYVSEWGYEFKTAYAFAVGNQSVYHYLMVRKEK